MRTLFGHGTPRQAADAVLAALVAALGGFQIPLRKAARFAECFFGTILPHATAHRRAADLAA